jgi:RHS repeat-associated protein
VGKYGVMDDCTGLLFMRARYYDPVSGRFLSEDPLNGDVLDPSRLNLYIYVKNNPVFLIDPTGLKDWGQILHGIGEAGLGLVSIGVSIVTTVGTAGAATPVTWVGIALGASAFYQGFADIGAGMREEQGQQHTLMQDVAGLGYIGATKITGTEATERGLNITQGVTGVAESGLSFYTNAGSVGLKNANYAMGYFDPRTGRYISNFLGTYRIANAGKAAYGIGNNAYSLGEDLARLPKK